MKRQTHSCTDLDMPDMKKTLLQNKGKLEPREYVSNHGDRKTVINVSWNKEKMSFNCSIAYIKKQKNGKWENPMRWDDAHGFRHFDSQRKLKMPSGRLLKLQCPILIAVINSMPKDKADRWKEKLFDEYVIGKQKEKEFLDNICRKSYEDLKSSNKLLEDFQKHIEEVKSELLKNKEEKEPKTQYQSL